MFLHRKRRSKRPAKNPTLQETIINPARAAAFIGLTVLAGIGSQANAQSATGVGGGGGAGAGPGASQGVASTSTATGWYGGFNVGQSRANIDDGRISSSLLGAGFASSTISHDERDSGYKIFAGYKVNRNFALEGGYFDLGKFGFTATTVPAGTFNGNIKLRGFNLDAVGIVPLADRFSLFGRVGVNYAEAKDSFSGTGAVTVTNRNPSKSEANYKLGIGLQYDFTNALGVRLEAERYRINDAVGNRGDVDLVSLGLGYRFGAR
jgi:OOP family OmpA-OmpF porin